jgi:hypothetical protein
MLSKRFHRRLCVLICTGLFALSTAIGDTLQDKDSQRFGKIIKIDGQGVTFLQGCSGNRVTILWRDLEYAKFDDSCDPRQFGVSISPATEDCPDRLVYGVALKGASDRVYGTDLSFDDESFILTLVNDRGNIRIPSDQVKSKVEFVRRDRVCLTELDHQVSLPAGITIEP